jgi:adenylate cyclase
MIWPLSEELYDEIFEENLGMAVFNGAGYLESHSQNLHMFLLDPSPPSLLNRSIFALFPELVGYEQILAGLRQRQRKQIILERIFRPSLFGKAGYVSLRVKAYRDGWLILMQDTTTTGLLEQRITQQRNELNLLSSELAEARKKLDTVLRTFVPTTVVDSLLESSQILPGGERRLVTVLFADLRGYTAWAEKRSPEAAIVKLNQVLGAAFEFLASNGATINQLMGDGFMSIFNAPLEQPDHAALALQSARQIVQLPGFDKDVRFGVGINTGMAMVGNVGSIRAMDYSAIGTTTNIAFRLQAAAQAGEVLFGKPTQELAGGRFPHVFYDSLQLKGIREPFPTYKLVLDGSRAPEASG